MNFFVTGGTLPPDAPSYVERQADLDLYENLLRGEYCYVLTARQMGKSSLMVRTAEKLRAAGVGARIADLTSVGQNLTVEQWYVSLLGWIGMGLEGVEEEIEEFWLAQPLVSPVQKMVRALREVILPRFDGPLVVSIDEVDYVKSLPFPLDEFFAAVRECYNLRAEDARMRWLTFCLVGVATPSDLIRDKRTTPFNIGRRIELSDFTAAEAAALARGLGQDGQRLLDRVLHWTGGHPYLTQRLCRAVVEANPQPAARDPQFVDHLCEELFFTRRARDLDDNLLFVRECLLRDDADRVGLLDLYAKLGQRRPVLDDGADPLTSALRLSGIARADGDRLRVRNRIYERVFDDKWVESNLPGAEVKQRRAAYRRGLLRAALAGAAILLLVGALAIIAFIKSQQAASEAEKSRRAAYYAQIRVAEQEWTDGNVSRVEEILASLKPEAGQEDLRGFEWHYLWQLSHRHSQSLRLDQNVAQAAFTPDGRQIVTCEAIRAVSDGTPKYRLRFFDWASGTESRSFETPSSSIINLVSFPADLHEALVESEKNTARLLDLQTGNTLATLNGHEAMLSALALSPDGLRAVTGDRQGVIKLWRLGDKASAPRLLAQANQPDVVGQAAFSHDGRRSATIVAPNLITLWDAATGRELRTAPGPAGRLDSVVFAPDDRRLLLASGDGMAHLLDLDTEQFVAHPTGHTGRIAKLVFSPDGKLLATAGEDRVVRLRRADDWRLLATIKGHGASVNALAWSPDNQWIVTGSDDKQAKIWNVNETIKADAEAGGAHVDRYLATAFSERGELLAFGSSNQGRLQIVNVLAGREMLTLREAGAQPVFAVFSRDARLVAAGGANNSVTIWEVATGRKITELAGKDQSEVALAADFSPDGRQLAFRYDTRSVKLWDVTTGRETLTLTAKAPGADAGEMELSQRVTFSPSGELLAAAGGDGSVVVWRLAPHNNATRPPMIFRGHTDRIRAIAFSLDETRLATGGRDNQVRLWDLQERRELAMFGQTDYVQRMAFSPDGKRLITGGHDGSVKIWDAATGQQLLTLGKYKDQVTSVTFSPDGKRLATCGYDGVARLWQIGK
jgi:WD40 repeat protein